MVISMKIEIKNDKVIVYLYNKLVDISNHDGLNNRIKDLFVKIMKRYNLDFFGYNKVNVYHNKNYGIILEIEKIYNSESRYNIIDLKVIVYKDIPMYLEFDNLYSDNIISEIIVDDGKYYLEINNSIDVNKYIEYGKVKYLPNLKKLKKVIK